MRENSLNIKRLGSKLVKKRFATALIISVVNLGTLTLMLALWTDGLELTLNDFVRPIEFLKIIGITISSLICVNILTKYLNKKDIDPQSTNIQYEYAFDGFLPDYYIEISYDLPINILIDSFSISEAEFSKSLSFEVVGDLKRISYSEMLQ